MNQEDEGAQPERPRHHLNDASNGSRLPGARVTGIQNAEATVQGIIASWRGTFSPREYAVSLDLAARIIGAEQARTVEAWRRWVA